MGAHGGLNNALKISPDKTWTIVTNFLCRKQGCAGGDLMASAQTWAGHNFVDERFERDGMAVVRWIEPQRAVASQVASLRRT
jgi:hypothetical protein